MISRVKNWYGKRRRAEKLGSGGGTVFWYDPVTEESWMASHRWSVLSVDDRDPPEKIAKMLYHVHTCELTDDGRKHLDEKYK